MCACSASQLQRFGNVVSGWELVSLQPLMDAVTKKVDAATQGCIVRTVHGYERTSKGPSIEELSKMISHLGYLVTWQTWTKPLHDISVILSLNINCVDFILIEMSMILLWELNIFAIFA